MKFIKKFWWFLGLAGLIFLLVTCNKSGGGGAIKIEGFTLTDYNGNLLGHNGPADSDWIFISHLSAAELSLFDFPTSLSDDNTNVAGTSRNPIAYPNPVGQDQILYFTTDDIVILKLVVVNASLQVKFKTALKLVKGGNATALNFRDRGIYPNKSVYRVYYSLSAKGHPDYKFGYGDIKICDSTNISDCF